MGKKHKATAVAPVEQREAVTRVGSLVIPSPSTRGMGADMAMRVPAFRRGSNLISGTVAQLPLTLWRSGEAIVPSDIIIQPEVDLPYYVTMQRTAEDLLHYARGYWKVILTDSDGYPTKVALLPAADVSENDATPGWVTYKGEQHRLSDPLGPGTKVGHVIKFTGFRKGVLADGIDVIENAIALENAALNYSKAPLPMIALKNEGADLTSPEVQELLAEWETARSERATAYLNSVMTAQTFGWSAAEMQLVEGRNALAIQIARLLGLDPLWVGAAVAGSSLTYTNRIDARRDLITFTITDYINPIEQRLSMRDVTPTKFQVIARFNTNDFLRTDVAERANIVTTLFKDGLITEDEARDFMQDNPNPTTYPT